MNIGEYKKIMFVSVILAAVVLSTAVAAQQVQDSGGKKVLTDLDQRMQRKISVSFRDIPIDDVIRSMAQQAEIDIVKSPKVTGNVTTTLTDIPLGEALDNILTVHGYTYTASRNMIKIVPISDISATVEKVISRIYRIAYADVENVEKALKKFISDRGSIASNPGTGNIIVTDVESKIKAIDTFIDEIDRITPQVLVEVRIYDITSKDRLDLGVSWKIGTNTSFDPATGDATTVGDATKGGTSKTNSFTQGILNSVTDKSTGSDNSIRFGVLNSSLDIDVILRAMQEDICATLLSNPRILVLDSERAVFKSVSEIPYQQLLQTSAGGQIGTTEFREVGVSLEVIPHVARDGMIRLRVVPEFSIATGSVTVGGFAITSPQPVVDTRQADTTLLVKDGQTIVLGGLRKKETSQQTNKVPVLGDLPLLGGLFKYEGEETINSEMVVLITPRIIIKSKMNETERKQFEATEFETCWPKCAEPKIDRCGQ